MSPAKRKRKRPAFKEADLYPPLRTWLEEQGYTVRSEVENCDVVAVRGEEIVVVELKRQLSVDLLIQAAERQRRVESVYLAVPPSKSIDARWKDLRRLLRRLELGLLVVAPKRRIARVTVMLHPEPYEPKRQSRYKRAILREVNGRSEDYNAGGSRGRKLVTAYRENAIFIACCLEAMGPMSPKKLRELGTGDKTLSILYNNVYEWFERVDRGVYALTDAGRKELETFAHAAAKYREELRKTA